MEGEVIEIVDDLDVNSVHNIGTNEVAPLVSTPVEKKLESLNDDDVTPEIGPVSVEEVEDPEEKKMEEDCNDALELVAAPIKTPDLPKPSPSPSNPPNPPIPPKIASVPTPPPLPAPPSPTPSKPPSAAPVIAPIPAPPSPAPSKPPSADPVISPIPVPQIPTLPTLVPAVKVPETVKGLFKTIDPQEIVFNAGDLGKFRGTYPDTQLCVGFFSSEKSSSHPIAAICPANEGKCPTHFHSGCMKLERVHGSMSLDGSMMRFF